ncbi:50S ribosomal protein L11 methyltransferase [Methanothermobacter sp.]|uniref:RsmD family RNA methyltransferase n=1 Tax=Methanothermobacter sp. TaxID=1884223 RepID=UPI00262B5A14|nr:50S ribosomal protein L11 methyltransferase [Methanothermobacter sp.]MDI9618090.1 RsmD family RNA methyltransferase [Methanothermobacter sp.]
MSARCPVCGEVFRAHNKHELEGYYDPCEGCINPGFRKFRPIMEQVTESALEECECGRRHLDSVMAQVSMILIENGVIPKNSRLRDAGVPLITPAFPLKSAPFLPADSLVLLTPGASVEAAELIINDVPEVKGVIRGDPSVTPGVIDSYRIPEVYDLLAGCDMRCDIIETPAGSMSIYRRQSRLHIEFSGRKNKKIEFAAREILSIRPETVLDATCGPGTLGIFALMAGADRVVFNDIWRDACEMTHLNLQINGFRKERFRIYSEDIRKLPEILDEKFDLCIVDPFPGVDVKEFLDAAGKLAERILLIQ